MPLNCRAGDLAVAISDEPGCEDNIGRIVQVLQPVTVRGSSQAWWRVQPLGRQPWTCIQPIQGGRWVEVFKERGRVLIEDHCLRPIRGNQPATERCDAQQVVAPRQKSTAIE